MTNINKALLEFTSKGITGRLMFCKLEFPRPAHQRLFASFEVALAFLTS